MAERWKWKAASSIWGLFCGAIYYPLFAAWTWGGGWLAKTWDTMSLGAGYVDFAGSGVVHAVGGVAALAGAIVLGPRIGKFGPDGKPRAIPATTSRWPCSARFILLFGWFGFNAASTFAATDVQFADGRDEHGDRRCRSARSSAMFWMHVRGPASPIPGMMVNGMLAGLVAITAPCAFVARRGRRRSSVSIAAVLVIEAVVLHRAQAQDRRSGRRHRGARRRRHVRRALRRHLRQRQLRRRLERLATSTGVKGLFYGDVGQFGAQLLGVVVIWTVIFGIAFGFFKIQNKLTKGGIRPSEDDEIAGLDMPEMGVLAYPNFPLTSSSSVPVP